MLPEKNMFQLQTSTKKNHGLGDGLSHSAVLDLEIKLFERLDIFPTKYEIPKSLKG